MNRLGLDTQRLEEYSGLGYSGLEVGGLGTLIRAGLQGGAHIVRPFISHSGQTKYLHIAISTYHQKEGLSRPLKKGGNQERHPLSLVV